MNELIRLAQLGDIEARNKAVMANTRLVAKLAFAACGGSPQLLDDYIQAGIVGHGAGNGLINSIMTYQLTGQPHALGTWPAYAKRGILSALNAFAPDAGREITTRRRREKQHKIRQFAKRLSCYEPDLLAIELAKAGIKASEQDIYCALQPAKGLESRRKDELRALESEPHQEAQEMGPDKAKLLAALAILEPHIQAAIKKKWGFGRSGGRLSCGEQEAAAEGESKLREILADESSV